MLGQSEYSPTDTGELRVKPRRRLIHHPLVLGLLVAAVGGLCYLAYWTASRGDSSSSDLQSAQEQTTGEEVIAVDEQQGVDAVDDTAVIEPDDTQEVVAAPSAGTGGIPSADIPVPTSGPYVAAKLNLDAAPGEGMVVLTGRVPDEQTAAAVTAAAEASYAPFVQNELEIDPTLEAAPWLGETAPKVIGILPGITDGTIMLADETILLSARSPNEEYLQLLQGGLTFLGNGIPVQVTDTRITNLAPPLFNATYAEETLTLSGFVPSEQELATLYGGAVAAYGEENVVNNLTIDDSTYSSFWMRTMPGVYQLFLPFDGYVFNIEQGLFSGAIQGGVNFEVASDTLNEVSAQALTAGVAVMIRDPSIAAIITGHTDNDGTEEYNQELSQGRAQSVVDFIASNGVSTDRLVAVGAGESQPIADNTTEEGKARNRRVEFQFGTAEQLAEATG